MKIAAYCRVSTEKEAQIDLLQSVIKLKSYGETKGTGNFGTIE